MVKKSTNQSLPKLVEKILQFRNDRNWKQFNNPKDMSLSLVLEATEVMEHFQWKNGEQVDNYIKSHKKEISEELADVLYWVLLIGNDLDIDVLHALGEKMKINEVKYPIEKAKNKHQKYNEL